MLSVGTRIMDLYSADQISLHQSPSFSSLHHSAPSNNTADSLQIKRLKHSRLDLTLENRRCGRHVLSIKKQTNENNYHRVLMFTFRTTQKKLLFCPHCFPSAVVPIAKLSTEKTQNKIRLVYLFFNGKVKTEIGWYSQVNIKLDTVATTKRLCVSV